MESNDNGSRKGRSRPPRKEPRSTPIWCGQLSEARRQAIIDALTPDERFAALWAAVQAKRGPGAAGSTSLQGTHDRNAHRPMAGPQVAMKSVMCGLSPTRPPGMNALADRLRTMNGAWLEDRRGDSVRLVRGNILDAEPHS